LVDIEGVLMPNNPTPKKTLLPKYTFGSAKAAQTQQVNKGTTRQTAELPRTLEALERLLKKD
jgi:hypothetical protein